MGKKDRYETKRSGRAWWGKTKARTIKDIRTESWRCTMEHSQPFQVDTKVNYSSCNSCNHGRTFRSCDDDNYVPFDGKKCFEASKLFSLSNSNQTNKNRFLYSTILLACLSSGIAQVVEGADIGEISRVQLWPGEDSGRTTTLFTRVNLVPKCTDDSQCTGEQICHFPVTGKQLLSGFHLTDRPLVMIILVSGTYLFIKSDVDTFIDEVQSILCYQQPPNSNHLYDEHHFEVPYRTLTSKKQPLVNNGHYFGIQNVKFFCTCKSFKRWYTQTRNKIWQVDIAQINS